ncbi:MAG: glycosyltransferase family 39 protein [Crocinitomicaceae bacterium]|nr:glycosyltransferase family 39 protein [Crocinitomicaceae bacterium]
MYLLKRNIDLILILMIGFALRFSVSITHSYTNDELSAINRLRYDSFSDLIEKGVKEGDMHPAGVQVFEKIWSSLFGTSELALRLPFVLFGTASIFLIFLIGSKWFNRKTGIFAAAILAVLYFPIVQSELARPYSPGLFITLLTAWYYHKVLFCEVKKYSNTILLGLCFAAGMYTHYFLFLFLIFIGFTGLIFLRKDNFKLYLLSSIIAVLLFIPHISITLHHLSVGGLGWLGKPDSDFLFQFIFYAFNESWMLLMFLFVLILFSFFQKDREAIFKSKYYWLSATWFFGIYILAHAISLYATPLLKFPVMLFAFPFLILMIAYLISNHQRDKLIVAAILVLGITSSVLEQDLYGNRHLGFKYTAKHLVDWNQKYGDENIYTVYNLSNPNYMNFYATQYGDSIQFDWDVIEFADDAAIRRDLMNRTEKYCVVGYSERLTLPQVFETVKEFYPFCIESYHYDNSAVFLMSKDSVIGDQSTIFEDKSHQQNLGKLKLTAENDAHWIRDNQAFQVIKLNSDSAKKSPETACYILENDRIYGPDFIFKKSDIIEFEHYYLKIIVKGVCPAEGQLTVAMSGTRNGEIIQNNGEIFWMGHDLEEMLITTADSSTGIGSSYFAFEIPDFIKDTDELKISLWNFQHIDT